MKSRTKPALRVVPAAQVQLSLPIQGVLQDVKHAFYGLCITAGKQVLAAMMEADRIALCGPKGVPDADRRALRGGSTRSAVVLGGQRIGIKRPRARSVDAGEMELPSFAWAGAGDPLDAATMAAIAAGVSMRRYASTLEELPPPEQALSVSKSATSRRFVALSEEQLLQRIMVRGPEAEGRAGSGTCGRDHRPGHLHGGVRTFPPASRAWQESAWTGARLSP